MFFCCFQFLQTGPLCPLVRGQEEKEVEAQLLPKVTDRQTDRQCVNLHFPTVPESPDLTAHARSLKGSILHSPQLDLRRLSLSSVGSEPGDLLLEDVGTGTGEAPPCEFGIYQFLLLVSLHSSGTSCFSFLQLLLCLFQPWLWLLLVEVILKVRGCYSFKRSWRQAVPLVW